MIILVSTINDHLPFLHRYVKLRKKVLGLDELHMYDLYTPLVKDVKMEISYDEAKDMILKGLAPLGEDYIGVLKEGFENRWVDVHENKGKRSGAYSSGAYGTNPYVLMNWQNNVNNLFTLHMNLVIRFIVTIRVKLNPIHMEIIRFLLRKLLLRLTNRY